MKCYLISISVLLCCVCGWMAIGCTRPADSVARTMVSAEVKRDYHGLLNRILSYPAKPSTSWEMMPDHLFSIQADDHENLRLGDACIRFTRRDGALDLLFEKIIDTSTPDVELLAVAEILVFWAGYELPEDASKTSHLGLAAQLAIDSGRLNGVQQRYPSLPIKNHIMRAIEKATGKGELKD